MKILKVTLKNPDFSYSVVVEAEDDTSMKEIQEKAKKKIKEQYGFEIPVNASFEIEFEIIG